MARKSIKKMSVVELPPAVGSISDTLNVEDKITNAPSINLVQRISGVPIEGVIAIDDDGEIPEGWEEIESPLATSEKDGLMSAGDKAKLDALDMGGVITITKSVYMATANSWYDTGITGEYLASGTYIVQMLCQFDGQAGQWGEYYSGVMSWYDNHTDGDGTSHITLHNAGHSDENAKIQLRTLHQFNTNHGMKLQILATKAMSASKNVQFKFRRII